MSHIHPRTFFQRCASRSRRLGVEYLERRNMLTTFFVDGSVGGGGTGAPNDPFDTIQAAIDAAEASPGPDSIKIAAGIYHENLTIEDPGRLTINGGGATVVSAVGDDEHTIEIDDTPDITIRDLIVVDGDDGIRADDVGSLTLINVEASGNADEGAQANDCGTVRLIDVNLSGNGGDGIAVEVANEVQIVGGTFNNDSDGIDLEGVGSIHLTNVLADGNADEGVEVDDSGSIHVVGGIYTNNVEAGLDIDDTLIIDIIGVTATSDNEHGLQIEAEEEGVQSVSVVNSTFSNNVGDGIQIVEVGALVGEVRITNVVVANNTEIDPLGVGAEQGGHGLYIDISGTLRLRNVTSEGNDNPDVLP